MWGALCLRVHRGARLSHTLTDGRVAGSRMRLQVHRPCAKLALRRRCCEDTARKDYSRGRVRQRVCTRRATSWHASRFFSLPLAQQTPRRLLPKSLLARPRVGLHGARETRETLEAEEGRTRRVSKSVWVIFLVCWPVIGTAASAEEID